MFKTKEVTFGRWEHFQGVSKEAQAQSRYIIYGEKRN